MLQDLQDKLQAMLQKRQDKLVDNEIDVVGQLGLKLFSAIINHDRYLMSLSDSEYKKKTFNNDFGQLQNKLGNIILHSKYFRRKFKFYFLHKKSTNHELANQLAFDVLIHVDNILFGISMSKHYQKYHKMNKEDLENIFLNINASLTILS